jgi:hypothetical protein
VKKLFSIVAILVFAAVILFGIKEFIKDDFTNVTLANGTKIFFSRLQHDLSPWVKNRPAEKTSPTFSRPFVVLKNPITEKSDTIMLSSPQIARDTSFCGGGYWKVTTTDLTTGKTLSRWFYPTLLNANPSQTLVMWVQN